MNAVNDMELHNACVRQAFAQARCQRHARQADIAQQLGLSEAALLAAHTGVFDLAESPMKAMRLRLADREVAALLFEFSQLGRVLTETSNAVCCHGLWGRHGQHACVRVAVQSWAQGFMVQERTAWGMQRSVQLFDGRGDLRHRVVLEPDSDLDAWAGLVMRWSLPPGADLDRKTPVPSNPMALPTAAALRSLWAARRQPAEWDGLLQAHGAALLAALQDAVPGYAKQEETALVGDVLVHAAQTGLPLTLEVAGAGTWQRYSGSVQEVKASDGMLSVHADGFACRINETQLAAVWQQHLPSPRGLVSLLRLFDGHKRWVATLSSPNSPAGADHCRWRQLLTTLTAD